MRILSVFEDMEPTYAELADALITLGFEDQSTESLFRFYHKKDDWDIIRPYKKLHLHLDAGRFGGLSSELEHAGIIEHMDDLGKMIKAKRLAVAEQVARQAPPKKAARKARPAKATSARQA